MTPSPIVAGQRVALTAPERDEFVERWRDYNDPELGMLLGSPTIGSGLETRTMPPCTREHRDALYGLHVERRLLFFDIRLVADGMRCIGEACLFGFSWPRASGDASVVVFDTRDRGNRLGSEATGLLCAYAFDGLGFHRIAGRVPVDNAAATKAAERMAAEAGARHVGIEREADWAFGGHRDVTAWEVLSRDFPPHPATRSLREPPAAL